MNIIHTAKRDTQIFLPIWERRISWIVMKEGWVGEAQEKLLIVETNLNPHKENAVTQFSGRFVLAEIENIYKGSFYIDWFYRIRGGCAVSFKSLYAVDQYNLEKSRAFFTTNCKCSSISVGLNPPHFENLIQEIYLPFIQTTTHFDRSNN